MCSPRFPLLTSQVLTHRYYGLLQLHEHVKERELAVFFRNNHFSTLFKYNGALYLLVTDLGFREQPKIVWERLDEVRPRNPPPPNPAPLAQSPHHHRDTLVFLLLQS